MDLHQLRVQIDAIDRDLVSLLERRMDVAAAIARYKQSQGLPVLDAGREAEKIASVLAMCRADTGDLIAGLYGPIMAASRTYQARIMERADG